MNVRKDYSGNKYNSWTLLYRVDNDKHGKAVYMCRCDCGTEKPVSFIIVKNGHSKCCGRCKGNTSPLFVRVHKNRLYHVWSEMRRRCTDNTLEHARYYVGKNISYFPDWDDFDVFANWAIENGYEPGLEIDRIDSDKDYSPSNCRWVSHKKNSRNRKARSNNTTGVPGVYPRTYKSGKTVYRATIATDAGKINLGTFETIAGAAEARRKAELEYWGFNIGAD